MQPTGSDRAAPAAPRVWIVDDSRLFRAAVAGTLERKGFDVVVADGGPDALALLPGADVVLFDTELPGLDGSRLLTALSRDGRLHGRAVVAMTGSTDPAVIDRLRGLGAQQVLVKSFHGVDAACRAVEYALPLAPPQTPRPVAA